MYSIQQASLLAQIPSSTIRYYEKITLIPPIKRNKQEHRTFDDKDIEILNLIRCFRRLGMSIKDIRASISNINLEYKDLNTKTILFQHKKKLEEQIAILNSYIHEIDKKIVIWNFKSGFPDCLHSSDGLMRRITFLITSHTYDTLPYMKQWKIMHYT